MKASDLMEKIDELRIDRLTGFGLDLSSKTIADKVKKAILSKDPTAKFTNPPEVQKRNPDRLFVLSLLKPEEMEKVPGVKAITRFDIN